MPRQPAAAAAASPQRATNSTAAGKGAEGHENVNGNSELLLDAIHADDLRSWISKSALKPYSHELPSASELAAADKLIVYDVNGETRTFSELYKGQQYYGHRQLIVFIRNVYCHICQHYVRRLVESVPPTAYFKLPKPTTITIITCGEPQLLTAYAKQTSCPFRIYTDPSRVLYKTLGMSLSFNPGKEPAYAQGDGVIKTSLESWAEMSRVRPIKDAFKGGNMFQIGGEFLFEEGEPIWCHRMEHMRDHSEMTTITRILGHKTEG